MLLHHFLQLSVVSQCHTDTGDIIYEYEIQNSLMKYASNVHINKSRTSLQKRDNE